MMAAMHFICQNFNHTVNLVFQPCCIPEVQPCCILSVLAVLYISGDILLVYEKQLDGWWQGELNGQVGIFPATYVEELPM